MIWGFLLLLTTTSRFTYSETSIYRWVALLIICYLLLLPIVGKSSRPIMMSVCDSLKFIHVHPCEVVMYLAQTYWSPLIIPVLWYYSARVGNPSDLLPTRRLPFQHSFNKQGELSLMFPLSTLFNCLTSESCCLVANTDNKFFPDQLTVAWAYVGQPPSDHPSHYGLLPTILGNIIVTWPDIWNRLCLL